MIPSAMALPLPRENGPSIATGCRVETVDSIDRFTSLAPEWNALLQASDAQTPFLTWEWLYTWWAHFGRRERLRICLVRNGSELIGIAPFRTGSAFGGTVARLEWLGTGRAGSDYLDIIASRPFGPVVLAAVADWCGREGQSLDLVRLPEGSAAQAVASHLLRRGWRAQTWPDGVCPHVPLAGHTWESLLASLGPAHRANVRRRLRSLARRYEVRFERVTDDDRRRQVLGAVMTFHQQRFASASSAFGDLPLRRFHDDVTYRALKAGSLWLHALTLNDRIAAVMYGFALGSRVYFYQHGFDERFRADSVGLAVMAQSIGAAIDEGATDFDMLWGDESYKSLWASAERRLFRMQLFPPHLTGQVHRVASGAERRFRGLARRLLPRASS